MASLKMLRLPKANWGIINPIFYRHFHSSRPLSKDYGKTFDKILIANRGEIACRVIKSAKKMGIKTVAVYSEADANSLFVKQADEAYLVGPPPTNQSYLNIPNILQAIKDSGAQAVHPGYGFLSENSHFVKALDEAGVAFIGPHERSMYLMGDKIQSKLIAAKAGVNCIPGFQGVVENIDHALQIAKEIGYPVMIKASAGGGGKGMRIAWNDEEVRENFTIAKTESMSSFGDDRLLIERYIDNPRHIEIQLIGDKHGNCVYLPERECSIQRRNQKVIEEAPSVFIDSKTRKAMGEQAVALAKNVQYDSAGTVEFLVDSKRNFFFLEMNTRLQVEHPITEYVTDLDLVELMIRVAAGQRLPLQQKDVKINGWAIESRIYAEDPEKFLPSIGTLTRYIEPHGKDVGLQGVTSENVRCDSGIVEGSEISIYYDPLICKLSSWGKNRNEALSAMTKALNSYVIKGVTHNIPVLFDVITHHNFVKGNFSTKFLGKEYPGGFQGHKLTKKTLAELLAVSGIIHVQRELALHQWVESGGQTRARVEPKDWLMVLKTGIAGKEMGKKPYEIVVKQTSEGYEVTLPEDISLQTIKVPHFEWVNETPLISAVVDHGSKQANLTLQYLNRLPIGFRVIHYGTKFDVQVLTPRQNELSKFMKEKERLDTDKFILAPMPGSIVSVAVKEGDIVAQGNELAVVEAMKMQNVLKAPRGGKIKKVNVKPGQSVQGDDILIQFEDEPKEEQTESP